MEEEKKSYSTSISYIYFFFFRFNWENISGHSFDSFFWQLYDIYKNHLKPVDLAHQSALLYCVPAYSYSYTTIDTIITKLGEICCIVLDASDFFFFILLDTHWSICTVLYYTRKILQRMAEKKLYILLKIASHIYNTKNILISAWKAQNDEERKLIEQKAIIFYIEMKKNRRKIMCLIDPSQFDGKSNWKVIFI